jgi:hypothetical protein
MNQMQPTATAMAASDPINSHSAFCMTQPFESGSLFG